MHKDTLVYMSPRGLEVINGASLAAVQERVGLWWRDIVLLKREWQVIAWVLHDLAWSYMGFHIDG